MDNAKMGELIREARKEKGLTQKDVAEQFGITDRAVSKWERGICAPDIAILEPLAQLLGLSVAELISGERRQMEGNREEIEAVIKDTISYSKQEMSSKDRTAARKLAAVSVLAVVLSAALFFGCLWYNGFFHRIGKYPSPDGTTVTTVFDCRLGYGDPPGSGGFTLSDKGRMNGRTIYENGEFKGLWWSPDGRYQVVSMYEAGALLLSLADFTRNIGVNLSSRLRNTLYGNDFFADVPCDTDGRREITFDFIQWSDADPEKMLVFFCYTDTAGQLQEGYMWYDYETGKASGHMRIEQGQKDADPFNNLISGLMS